MTTLTPLPGFNWMLVQWGGPDETRTDDCSYCGKPFPTEDEDPGFVPLILWNADGWVAEFCTDCQAKWWGMQSYADPPEDGP